MATPLVAGCAAVLREVLIKHGHPHPSAALVKALIINGAVCLPGVSTQAQGFGRVNLKNSVAIITASGHSTGASVSSTGFHEGRPLRQGEKFELDIEAQNTKGEGVKRTLKLTLAYSDRPGKILQNNLNLIVLAADGTEKHGNGFEGDQYDEANNVEQVVWEGLLPGKLKVIVWAWKMTLMNEE